MTATGSGVGAGTSAAARASASRRPERARGSGEARCALIALLQLAFSGELAAAHAYRGHARSA